LERVKFVEVGGHVQVAVDAHRGLQEERSISLKEEKKGTHFINFKELASP
jgi:hypothetical protein